MLSARGEEVDRILGFELGADDYVTKPFSPRELVLRVKSILRRGKEARAEPLRISDVEVFPLRRQCLVRAEPIDLTAKEFDLLVRLMTAGGDVVGRDALLEEVWGYSGEATSRTLDTHVRRLREKLGPESGLIETVRGIGFRIGLPPKGEPE
jgi:two-component system phosphate regulon response regulator PhoB